MINTSADKCFHLKNIYCESLSVRTTLSGFLSFSSAQRISFSPHEVVTFPNQNQVSDGLTVLEQAEIR